MISRLDHPRSRGVYNISTQIAETGIGSSPLARGLRKPEHVGPVADGIIPARAGSTSMTTLSHPASGDHPRSRGVYKNRRDEQRRGDGSSPLARGLLIPDHSKMAQIRIIPARAGSTMRCGRRARRWGDHPRSRGVYERAISTDDLLAGSSPLARGLPNTTTANLSSGRIIPARAGSTIPQTRRGRTYQDHPRSRGVYVRSDGRVWGEYGSSPLARGLLVGCQVIEVGIGIIPARAGSTVASASRQSRRMDHPRSRGVYRTIRSRCARSPGSSPLARGLRSPSGGWGGRGGIIPARAGSTQGGEDVPGVGEDHPRSRGVYSMWQTLTTISHGSSPLARGLQVLYVPVHDV